MNAAPRNADWPEATATVTECRYDIGAGRAIAFGLPTAKRFRIRYNYWAGSELRTGEFRSATAVPQGTLFPLNYNPDAPQEHVHDFAEPTAPRTPMLAVGIIGSIILSLAWFLILRGCSPS